VKAFGPTKDLVSAFSSNVGFLPSPSPTFAGCFPAGSSLRVIFLESGPPHRPLWDAPPVNGSPLFLTLDCMIEITFEQFFLGASFVNVFLLEDSPFLSLVCAGGLSIFKAAGGLWALRWNPFLPGTPPDCLFLFFQYVCSYPYLAHS